MSTFHFHRKGDVTMCGVATNTLHPSLKVVMRTEVHTLTGIEFDKPRASLDLRNEAKLPHNKPKMLLTDACKACLAKRVHPWPKNHGITQEDVWADDDENWRRKDREARERTVD